MVEAVPDVRTIFDIARTIRQTDERGTVTRNAPTIVEGLTPQIPDIETGTLVTLTPSECAGLLINRLTMVEDDGERILEGYQRTLSLPHARIIARRLREGYPFPPILVGIEDDDDVPEVIEGQHRAVAAIIARRPILAVCLRLDDEDKRRLFVGQAKSRKPTAANIILSGNDVVATYLQDAVTSDDHPWSRLVSFPEDTSRYMQNKTAWDALRVWIVGRNLAPNAQYSGVQVSDEIVEARWDKDKADLLASLYLTFGTRKENPAAYTVAASRAILALASIAIAQRGFQKRDLDRWYNHMSKYDWRAKPWLRTQADILGELTRFWNLRLAAENRI